MVVFLRFYISRHALNGYANMVEIVDISNIHHLNVGHIESPGFPFPHPRIINIDLIPNDIRNAMRGAWDAKYFSPRKISVDKLFDVYVTEEGLVFTRDFRLISQTITQHSPLEQERALNLLINTHEFREITTSCLLMRKRGDDNYGHWLVEIMPKLGLARLKCHVSGLAIPSVGGAMRTVIHESINICDKIKTTPRFELKKNEAVFFKEIILVSGATQHGSYMSPLMISEIDDAISSIDGIKNDKIFISRRGTARNIANQNQIEDTLRENGFAIINPASMDFIDQIKSFKNAKIIIGVMGAGMTNIVFANSGARIINLSPATMPDTFFYFLSKHKGHIYSEIRGKNINDTKSWDTEFVINIDDLMSEIDYHEN